mgnify:CR=1 FL=1
MLAIFSFLKVQDRLQDTKTGFKGIVLQGKGIKSPPPCEQERAGKCLRAGNGSDKADEAVVLAVGFHVPGMGRVIQSGIVRVVGIREHGVGFFRVAAARSGVLSTHKGVFPSGAHQRVQELKSLGGLQWSHVFRCESRLDLRAVRRHVHGVPAAAQQRGRRIGRPPPGPPTGGVPTISGRFWLCFFRRHLLCPASPPQGRPSFVLP